MPQNTVYYWDGIVGDKESLQDYDDVIRQLLLGQYQAAKLDLKKCKGLRIYSVRAKGTERADRLLFTTIEKADGKRYLSLLEIIKNHNYQKSKILNSKQSVLQAYLDNDDPYDFSAVITQDEFADIDHVELDADSDDYQLKRIHYYQKTFLEFNETQEGSLQAPLPMVISGAPGSGKSCVATASLMQMANQMDQKGETGRVLYVAESPRLVNAIRDIWSALPKSYDRTKIAVNILSYDELLKRNMPQLADKVSFGEEQFNHWFDNYVAKKRAQSKMTKGKKKGKPRGKARGQQLTGVALLADNLVQHKPLVYQEFRIISGYSRNRYMELGSKQSLFDTKKAKQFLHAAYCAYLDYIAEQNAYCSHFITCDLQEKFKFIVVDEAQDFSFAQLAVLTKLVENVNICYALDTHQSLHDSQSIRPFLHELFFQQGIQLENVHLPSTYRCPPVVVDVANALLDIKHAVTGGTSDKYELNQIESSELVANSQQEKVFWYQSLPKAEQSPFPGLVETSEFAVITWPELYDEACEHFDTPLIFTPDQIKGLEYPHILLYRIFDVDCFKQINKQLHNVDIGSAQISHRPKNCDITTVYFRPLINSVFMSATRTVKTLYWIQALNHDNANITGYIQDVIARKDAPESSQQALPEKVETETVDWSEELARLVKNENFFQAKRIYDKYLSSHKASFLQIANEHDEFKAYLATTNKPPVVKKNVLAKKRKQIEPQTEANNYLDDKIPVLQLKLPNKKVKAELATIWSQFTEANAVRLLKNPALLFEYLMVNPDHPSIMGCMLTLITQEEMDNCITEGDRFETFLQAIKNNPRLITPAYGKYLSSYITYFQNGILKDDNLLYILAIPNSARLLRELIVANPKILDAMSFKIFVKYRTTNPGIFNVLSMLFMSIEGINVFNEILKHKNDWANYITRDLLVSDLKNHPDPGLAKMSLLILSSKSEAGREFIFTLNQNNPDFIPSFKREDFLKLIRPSVLTSENEHNAIHGFVLHDRPDKSMLVLLEEKLPGLITDMPFAILTKRMRVSDIAVRDFTILDSLLMQQVILSNSDGQNEINPVSQLAYDYFQHHPESYNKLSGDYFSHSSMVGGYCYANLEVSSILIWLNSPFGCHLFAKAISHNPRILHELDIAVMFTIHPDDSSFFAGLSPIFILASYVPNLPILSEYIKTLTAEAVKQYFTPSFLINKTHIDGFDNVSIMDCLVSSAEGMAILQQLLEINPDLVGILHPSHAVNQTANKANNLLLKPIKDTAKQRLTIFLTKFTCQNIQLYFTHSAATSSLVETKYNNANFLVEAIFSTPERLPLLTKAIEMYPDIAKQTYWGKALTAIWENQSNNYRYSNGLQVLLQHPNGLAFFKALVAANPDILGEITYASLIVHGPHPHTGSLNLSPLFFLTMNADGVAILDKLFTKDSPLMQQLNIISLTLEATDAQFLDGLFPLFNLCFDANCHYFLIKIFNARPDILEKMDLNFLKSKRKVAEVNGLKQVSLIAKFVHFYKDGTTELVDYLCEQREDFQDMLGEYMNTAVLLNSRSTLFRSPQPSTPTQITRPGQQFQ